MTRVSAAVRTSGNGSPIAIRVAGTDYVATGRPQLWIDRAPWWEQPASTVVTARDLERERWTVPSTDANGRQVLIELAHDRTRGRWELLDVQ